MRKKSIVCSCGLQDESVNLFLITTLYFADSLGCSCIFYYTWISFLFNAPLIPNQSLQSCLSGHFWKAGFWLYDPPKKQHSRKSSVYIRKSGPLNIMDIPYITVALATLQKAFFFFLFFICSGPSGQFLFLPPPVM